MRVALGLLLLAFAVCAPQLFLDDWRGTEARRVQIAREIAEGGSWLVPTLGGEETLVKPPLYYWVLAGLQKFSRDPAVMRLPSVVGFWLLALVCFTALRRHYGALAGWVAAVGILFSPVLLDHMPYAEIDPLFAVLTGISIVWLAEGASLRNRQKLMLAGAIGGLALLTKGPPYLLFMGGASLVWLRRLRLFGVGWFLGPLVVVPAIYYVPLLLGPASLESLAHVATAESVARLGAYELAHVLETPLYLAVAIGMVLPLGFWSFHEYRGTYGPQEMREAVTPSDEAFLRICAAAMIGAALLLVAFPARPSRYLIPGVACFLVALGPAVAAYIRHGDVPSLILSRVVRLVGVVASIGLIAAPWTPFPYGERTPVLLAVLAAAPLVVQSRRWIVAYFMFVPLVAAWTVMLDRAERRSFAPHSRGAASEIMLREIQNRSATDLSSRGHVAQELLLLSDTLIPGDERSERSPTSEWLLSEESDVAKLEPGRSFAVPGYVDRVRVRMPVKSLVLRQRQ